MRNRLFLVFTAALFLTASFVTAQTAQQQPPRPAGRGLTTSSTWTDDDLEKMMKQINTGAATLRKLIEDKAADASEAQADTLEHLFDDVEEFFVARKIDDARQWAHEATDHSNHVEDWAEAKDFTKAGEHMKLLTGTCQSCHAKYRERLPDGTYRFKKP